MRIVGTYSHLNGLEFLLYRKPALWNEIEGAIASVDANALPKKISREKGMAGRELFSPKEMNAAVGQRSVPGAGRKREHPTGSLGMFS